MKLFNLLKIYFSFLSKLVDKIDKNGDNNVSSSELAAWMKYISLKEPTTIVEKYWTNNFARIIDADGLISWEDYRKINFPGDNHGRLIFLTTCYAVSAYY